MLVVSVSTWTLAHNPNSGMHIPSVSIRSSQQFSVFTFTDHVSPDLSSTVAEVPDVMMLIGRDRGSAGGCNIAGGAARALDM